MKKPKHLTDATIRKLNIACYELREDGAMCCVETCIWWCEMAWNLVLGGDCDNGTAEKG